MVEVNTERLRLIPLDSDNLKLLIHNQRKLEKWLHLNDKSPVLDQELIQGLKFRLSKVLENEKDYIWYTNWAMVHKEKNCLVGGVMIKGKPNESGEVIVGYYTNPEHQGNGYMTEAINYLSAWLLDQPKVISVVADTEKDNIPSHRVLEKAGAKLYRETDELFFWKITR